MKYLLGLILAFSFISLHAYEVQVKKMSKDGELDRSYVLSTNVQDKVVLDCQSFIQGAPGCSGRASVRLPRADTTRARQSSVR